jgi:lipoprotein-anchoring transpeptidase ErfK/SrfK
MPDMWKMASPTICPTVTSAAAPRALHSIRAISRTVPVQDDLWTLRTELALLRRPDLEHPHRAFLLPTAPERRPNSAAPPPSGAMPQPTVATTVRPPSLVGKALVVDQDVQVLRVYEDGTEIRTLLVSTGAPPYYTPAFAGNVGHYVKTIYGFGEWADHAWYVFTASGNIYIHGAAYQLPGGMKEYIDLEYLGVQPSSHGCIRLHPADAEWLTAWDPLGVPILITALDLNRKS